MCVCVCEHVCVCVYVSNFAFNEALFHSSFGSVLANLVQYVGVTKRRTEVNATCPSCLAETARELGYYTMEPAMVNIIASYPGLPSRLSLAV